MDTMITSQIRTALLQTFVAVFAVAGGPLDELPIPTPPPDPYRLLDALHPQLQPNWHLGQPYTYLGIPYVRVFIQDEWRGSPVAAAIALCPGPENKIWQETRVIRLVMQHKQRMSPAYECRP
ncbi:MAG TPA: hypothetical protein VL614_30985 [Acetobacteraceae bacterium]|nr:hypothetical protein [Acetobacteraceae bacterium]